MPAIEKLSEQAAQTAGLPPVPPGQDWYLTTSEDRSDTSVDPIFGGPVTTKGSYRHYTLGHEREGGADGRVAVAAVGCEVSEFTSYPYRNYYGYPAYKYGPRAYSWVEVSSGCSYGASSSSVLRELHGVYKPTVDSARVRAEPGQKRTAYVGYTGLTQCENYRHVAHGRIHDKRVCP